MSQRKHVHFVSLSPYLQFTSHNASSIHDGIRDYSGSSSPRLVSPVKYPSLVDEDDKKNFFPVTWRVIGGGVRVGVVMESNDLILHDNGNVFEHSTPHKPSQLPPLTLPNRKRSNSIPSTPSNSLFNVEQVRYLRFTVNPPVDDEFCCLSPAIFRRISWSLVENHFGFFVQHCCLSGSCAFSTDFSWHMELVCFCKLLVVKLSLYFQCTESTISSCSCFRQWWPLESWGSSLFAATSVHEGHSLLSPVSDYYRQEHCLICMQYSYRLIVPEISRCNQNHPAISRE